jgi:hypothetical protein
MPRTTHPILIVLLIGGALSMSAARATEEPRHTVVYTAGSIEIRDYAPMILAQVQVAGGMGDASNRGFRPLANYIFGDNRRPGRAESAPIAMTTPVMQQRSATIAMTTPVTQARSEDGGWQVAFIMPQEWSLDTLPAPNDPAVQLQPLPARRMAVIRFAGGPSEERFAQKAAELAAFLAERGIAASGAPIYARYNPPWVPTPFRRNEVMIEIPTDQGGF